MKMNLKIGNNIIQFAAFKKPSLAIKGYTSRCEDGKHVLFLDYDMVNFDIVLADIKVISSSITHAIIFTTKEIKEGEDRYGNYHVICIDKFFFSEVLEIMAKTHADSYHRNLAKRTRYRAWVLRFTGKGSRSPPELKLWVDLIKYKLHTKQSLAHWKFITLIFPELKRYKEAKYFDFDGLTTATITEYNTIVEDKYNGNSNNGTN